MDPRNPQQPKRWFDTIPPVAPLSPAEEKLLDEYDEWVDEAKYRLQLDSSDDSDDAPWLSSPIVTTERRGSSSSKNRATAEAEKTTLPLEEELAYFNMLSEITKKDTATMSEAQRKAHDGQVAWLYNKLGLPKP
jgi:hypothetical protein